MNLYTALSSVIHQALSEVHTSIPGRVEEYDEKTHQATVRPTVRLMQDNGVELEIPPLMKVPVLFPASGAFDIEFPIAKGDAVLILFSEADTSEWVNSDGEGIVSPATSSRFGLNSAVAIPGLRPSRSEGNVRLYVNNDGVLTIKAKKIVFDGQVVATGDMIARGDVFVGPAPAGPGVSLKTHIHPTAVGPTSQATPAPIPPEV